MNLIYRQKKHFRSFSNNVVENFKSRNFKLEPNSLLEYEKEISSCEYLSDDSTNFLNKKPKKISDLKRDRNNRKMSILIDIYLLIKFFYLLKFLKNIKEFEITNEIEIDLDNKVFQKSLGLFQDKKSNSKNSYREFNEIMQDNFIDLIKQYSDIFQGNNVNGRENYNFNNDIISRINLLNLSLNFQDEFFKLMDEAEQTKTGEDDQNSCNNPCDNKKNCYDKYSNNTSSNSKSFKSLSLNIIGFSNFYNFFIN